MVCEAKEGVGFYRPRQPQVTPFYKLVARFYPEFERVYAERTQERYGFWRSTCPPKPRRRRVVARAVERFLDCGDLKKGFARVRCPKCRHELFVAFSCRGRCVCPSGLRRDRNPGEGRPPNPPLAFFLAPIVLQRLSCNYDQKPNSCY